MYQITDPAAMFEIADRLRVCIEEQISPEMARSCVISGEIAWDDCECGQLAVSVDQMFPYSQFPEPGSIDGTQGPCGTPTWGFGLTVSLLRCSPETEDESPPPCNELAIAAQQSIEDAVLANNALRCCLAGMRKDREIVDFNLGTTEFVGGEGLCQGSNTTVVIGIGGGCPCDSHGQN